MIDQKTAPYGALFMRVALGVMFIAHGAYLKVFVFTLPGTAQFFASLGLPGSLAYVVCAAETVGGILLILGVASRWVSLALMPILLGAIWTHSANGWVFSAENGGWEYPLFLAASALAVSLLGDGAHALGLPPRLSGRRDGVEVAAD